MSEDRVLVEDRNWQVESSGKCSYPGCNNGAVASMWRYYHVRVGAGMLRRRKHRYCKDHLYGRVLDHELNRVLFPVAPDSPAAEREWIE